MPLSPFRRLTALALVLGTSTMASPSATSDQTIAARWLERAWDASWIAPAAIAPRAYGVYHFRTAFDLDTAPSSFVVHISADNRYRLFVNGQPVHVGPARGDLTHWRFDTLDLAPHLHAGRNVLAAQVWNFGEHAPVAQVSNQTAFILQGDTAAAAVANTGPRWHAWSNPAYTPITDFGARLQTYIVVGPGDEVDGRRYPWGWSETEFDDSAWSPAVTLRRGEPRGTSTDGMWLLTPRQIPPLESRPIRLRTVRLSAGVEVDPAFVQGNAPVTVPAHTTARILLDQGELTTAYPELRVSGGAGSRVTLTYAESLYEGPNLPSSKIKGDRDEVTGKHLRGFFDAFQPDGGPDRLFRPLRWRAWRYLQLDVTTAQDPLELTDLTAEFTAYPFAERAQFQTDDPTLVRIWEICWRTLRTGTHDIFTDSPYYEQLSYVGDTRIEALVSLAVSGDDRLMRKSIEAFDESRNANGLTSSRWPDSRHQIIPPYSLVWISMVHDYWQWRDDPAFVTARLGGVREVLRYYAEHSDPSTGSYTGRLWWNYVDWIPAWGPDEVTGLGGVPPRDASGASAILDLQYVYTLRQAADLFAASGRDDEAAQSRSLAARLRQHVLDTCWDDSRQLLADTSEKLSFSQHANAYLILTSDHPSAYHELARQALTAPDITPASFYFSFYTHAAWIAAGLGDDYLDWLDSWRQVLAQGLTTVPETPGPASRSDSHAWGSHPILGFLTDVLGIQPGAAGFRSVRIAPHLGNLPRANGRLPHPAGDITVQMTRRADGGLHATVTLPVGLTGTFVWQGEERPLAPGEQTLEFPASPES